MKTRCISYNHISSLLVFMVLPILMIRRTQGVCIDNERKALLEIKASIHEIPYYSSLDNLLSTWVDHGECCDWERIKCNTSTGHITDLYLSNMASTGYDHSSYEDTGELDRIWRLNFSPFLQFKELRSLDLSWNYIHNITGLERLGNLKKLEMLNLSTNYIIVNNISDSPSFGALTSLKILNLSSMNIYPSHTPTYDISKLSALENLEVLDLTWCDYYGSLQITQDSKKVSILRKLKVLNLGGNYFTESIVTSLSMPSLEVLDLSNNQLSGSFSPQGTMSNLVNLNLDGSKFFSVDDVMRSMAAFPSLRFLSLEFAQLGGSLFANELPKLPHLEVLILGYNNFNGTLPMEALASFHKLEVLDLSYNYVFGGIPSTIKSLSSLKVLSFAGNRLNGSLPNDAFCNLKNLYALDLSGNLFEGNLPECFNSLSSLKFFDISSNHFTGRLSSSLIANLTSLEYVDFSYNKFEGPFLFSSFSNHTKLEAVKLICNNDMLEIETDDPIGWIPMFQLKSLVLSNCDINRLKGRVLPGFLVKQHELHILDMSQNYMHGQFPNWLIENNTMLEVINLSDNLFCGTIMLFNTNLNIKLLDISGNRLTGVIPKYIQKFLPGMIHLNLSWNSLDGVIPSSIGEMNDLDILDLSHNKLSGEIPVGLLANSSRGWLSILKLSNNRLHGEVLSGNLSLNIWNLYLDNNRFTGKLGNVTITFSDLLVISNNFFTGLIPGWISNMSSVLELVLRNNSFEGSFPCGTTAFSFLDISENSFSGPIPSCLNMQRLEHLHLGSNRFTGSIPNSFRNLTEVLTLVVSNNYLSGEIPNFLGELSNLRILLLGKNNFVGSIPKQLCQLTNVSLLDLSSNSLSGSIPGCLYNVTGPSYQVFMQEGSTLGPGPSFYMYRGVLSRDLYTDLTDFLRMQDEVLFTTKTLSLTYKGDILDIMSGLDLSCNKLTGDIPEELGLMTHIRALNLSHNMLTGPIPSKLSNLINIESLDLSSNSLTGKVPSELNVLNFLDFFNVSYNNLSGILPEMKAQFSTFTKESYKGNPLLCGLPLENKCTIESHVTHPSNEEGTDEKWYDMDMTSFYGSCGSAWFVFMLGFAALLYINPHWRRRWLYLVEECMYTCCYFLYDFVRNLFMLLAK